MTLRRLLILSVACLGILARDRTPPVPDKSLPAPAMAPRSAACPVLAVHFSPDGGCEQEWVARIGEATMTIRVAAYSFTSAPIAAALVAAKARGVDVAVVVDGEQPKARGNRVSDLIAAEIPVYADRTHKIMHHKFGVFDGSVVLTGSWNLTASAEHSNAENLVTIRDAAMARAYIQNWMLHRSHSVGP